MARSRSRSASVDSLSSGLESAYEPRSRSRSPSGSRSSSLSPSASRSPSGSRSPRSPRRSARAKPSANQNQDAASESKRLSQRADYKRYAHLLTSLAARDADELAPRLARTGVWSPRFWGGSGSPVPVGVGASSSSGAGAPRWATAPSATEPDDEGEGEGESEGEDELDPDSPDDVPEDKDDDVDADDVPQKYLRQRRRQQNRRLRRLRSANLGTDLAALTSSSTADPATRWPLHPTELAGMPSLPTLSAIRETAERQLRRHNLALPPDAEADARVNARRAQRLVKKEQEERRRRVPLRAPEKSLAGPSALLAAGGSEIMDVDVDVHGDDGTGTGFAADPEQDNYVPPAFAPRVAAALDRTLATLLAFRPKMTGSARGQGGGLDWRSVLGAAAMSVDRSVVERTAERLSHIFAPDDDDASGAAAASGTGSRSGSAQPAYPEQGAPPEEARPSTETPPQSLTETLRMRLDLVDEAGGPPRVAARDLAKELYVLPPLRPVRPVRSSKRGVYARSERDAAERAAVAERFAAKQSAAAQRKAEIEAQREAKRQERAERKEVYLAKARARAASRRARMKSEA